jgi:vacuolar protein sorting-associated protein VTA1
MAEPVVPAGLKPIERFIKTAKQLEKHDPIVAYYCRYYSVQQGIELRTKTPSEEAKTYLLSLMDRLEHDKTVADRLLKGADANTYMREFAARIFKRADDEDRAGRANKETARAFLHASIFFETCKLFGALPAEIAELVRYAKWRAGQINTAVREGRQVTPPQSGDEFNFGDDSELAAEFGNGAMEVSGTQSPTHAVQHVTGASPMISPTSTTSTSPVNNHVPVNGNVSINGNTAPQFTPTQSTTAHYTVTNHVPAQPVPRAPDPVPTHHVSVAHHVGGGFKPSDDALIEAQKFAKYVVSALQFDDVNTAVTNLKRCYALLTGVNL